MGGRFAQCNGRYQDDDRSWTASLIHTSPESLSFYSSYIRFFVDQPL